MKKKWLRRTLYTFILLFGLLCITFIWADNELNKILGKSTEVINIERFVKSSKIVQIRNTNILSEDCSYFIRNKDVILKEGKIVQIGTNLLLNSNNIIIDGTSKYLIPGLIDSHAHLRESKNDLFLYLVNGVTYIREMAGNAMILDWRKEINKNGIGPRLYVASPPIYSESGLMGYYYAWTRQSIDYSNKNGAQKAIRKIKQDGYDAIKMYGFVNPETFKTTIEIAKENHIPVIGHIPLVSLDNFYSSGQIEIAHIEEITKKTIDDFGKSIAKNPEEYLNFLKLRSNQIAKKLKENNISVTSTVWLCESFLEQRFELKSKLKEVELKYVNPKIIEGTPIHKLGWLPGKNAYEYDGKNNPEARRRSFTYWKTYAEAIHIMVKALIDNKVTLIAGTDSSVATVVAGFSLHDELESLTKSGMTNTQALYSATVAPSNWMKSSTGKIKIGYNADLVLLSKNPLDNIKNTKTIENVFFGTHMINKTQIKDILKSIERANNKNRSVKIDEYLIEK
ncbi:hypothetical protein BAS06_12780 [Elizabethkingia miricola]|uniref:amidohydrolase family protein n=1 Tax=Elizabethkingia miricola TaxID=172045 RepID=UPI00099A91A1|nr:amidohydrolase family protein [Elizabethkingia miricola]OPB88053.1 hypothetical protein BAS06_12780 [Elizabethkingia miricola]